MASSAQAVSDNDIRVRLATLVKGADLTITTSKMLREQLEKELGCLSAKRKFIDDTVMELVMGGESKQGPGGADKAESKHAAAQPASKAKKAVEKFACRHTCGCNRSFLSRQARESHEHSAAVAHTKCKKSCPLFEQQQKVAAQFEKPPPQQQQQQQKPPAQQQPLVDIWEGRLRQRKPADKAAGGEVCNEPARQNDGASSAVPDPTSVVKPEHLAPLLAMDFPRQRAVKALLTCRLDVDLAIDWLCDRKDDEGLPDELSDAQRRLFALGLGLVPPTSCTFAITGKGHFVQTWLCCYTCGLTEGKGCCVSCAKICHAGHDLSQPNPSQRNIQGAFFCDCGAGDGPHPCKCLPVDAESESPELLPLAVEPPRREMAGGSNSGRGSSSSNSGSGQRGYPIVVSSDKKQPRANAELENESVDLSKPVAAAASSASGSASQGQQPQQEASRKRKREEDPAEEEARKRPHVSAPQLPMQQPQPQPLPLPLPRVPEAAYPLLSALGANNAPPARDGSPDFSIPPAASVPPQPQPPFNPLLHPPMALLTRYPSLWSRHGFLGNPLQPHPVQQPPPALDPRVWPALPYRHVRTVPPPPAVSVQLDRPTYAEYPVEPAASSSANSGPTAAAAAVGNQSQTSDPLPSRLRLVVSPEAGRVRIEPSRPQPDYRGRDSRRSRSRSRGRDSRRSRSRDRGRRSRSRDRRADSSRQQSSSSRRPRSRSRSRSRGRRSRSKGRHSSSRRSRSRSRPRRDPPASQPAANPTAGSSNSSGRVSAPQPAGTAAATQGHETHNATAVPQAASNSSSSSAAAAEDRTLCVVCLSAPKECVFMDCRHFAACASCADKLQQRQPPTCPVCNLAFRDVMRIFNA